MSARKLYLLDGTAMVYRAYFAMRHTRLATQSGYDTRTLFGRPQTVPVYSRNNFFVFRFSLTNTLLPFLETVAPAHVVAVFDNRYSGSSFRKVSLLRGARRSPS